jgi:trk system potassium uptake protein TrkA
MGAGNAGLQLAQRLCLCEEKHSVVMMDTDPKVLIQAEAKLDVLTLCGPGSSPQLLAEAQVKNCHLVSAVTNRNGVNILACLYAPAAGVPRKVAHVSSPECIHMDDLYDLSARGVDLVINQKRESAHEIFNTLQMPGNTGPGLSAVEAAQNYAAVPMTGPIILPLCMLLGRLNCIPS